jgi:predicted ArsR family transcriptional regulator
MPRLSELDKISYLKDVHEHRSITEMANKYGVSVSTIHAHLRALETEGLIKPPEHQGAARSRTLTSKGLELVSKNGYRPR